MSKITVTDDRKQKHNSFEAAFDLEGYGVIGSIKGWGADREEALKNLEENAKNASLMICETIISGEQES